MFFNIDGDDPRKIKKLNQLMQDPKQNIFLFVYLEGCGPCNNTKQVWKNIPKYKSQMLYPNNTVVAKINQSVFDKLDNRLGESPRAFPAIYHIRNWKKHELNDMFYEPIKYVDWMNECIGPLKIKTKNKKYTMRKRTKKMKLKN